MPVYHFIGIIWQQYIHRSPRKSSETTSGWFLKVRSCLLVCSGLITLHCIVWAAILFPPHPYIESAIALSDTVQWFTLLLHGYIIGYTQGKDCYDIYQTGPKCHSNCTEVYNQLLQCYDYINM